MKSNNLIMSQKIKQKIITWKNKFNMIWNLPVIYEESILHESFIIENYF